MTWGGGNIDGKMIAFIGRSEKPSILISIVSQLVKSSSFLSEIE